MLIGLIHVSVRFFKLIAPHHGTPCLLVIRDTKANWSFFAICLYSADHLVSRLIPAYGSADTSPHLIYIWGQCIEYTRGCRVGWIAVSAGLFVHCREGFFLWVMVY
jgi:hypothetical protein